LIHPQAQAQAQAQALWQLPQEEEVWSQVLVLRVRIDIDPSLSNFFFCGVTHLFHFFTKIYFFIFYRRCNLEI